MGIQLAEEKGPAVQLPKAVASHSLVCPSEVDRSLTLALQKQTSSIPGTRKLQRDPALCSRHFRPAASVDSALEEMTVDWTTTRLPGSEEQ